MKKQKPKPRMFTGWFPVGSPPVRSGWYQIAYGEALLTYAWWDNFKSVWRLDPFGSLMFNFGLPQDSWRGITKEVYFAVYKDRDLQEIITAVTRLEPHRKMFI